MTIFEVLQKRNKEAVFDLKCKIVQVLAREHLAGVSAGSGKAYDFFTQKILLGDDTATLWAQLTDCPIIESKEIGQQVLISAKESKFGLLGANLSISADGKYRTLKISKTGTFCIGYDDNVAENARKAPELPIEPKKELEKTIAVPEIGAKISDNIQTAVNNTPTDWNSIERRKQKSILLSYAVELVKADKLKIEEIEVFITKWIDFIWGVKYPDENIDKPDYDDSPVYTGEDVPF